jgi:hypothetical protein
MRFVKSATFSRTRLFRTTMQDPRVAAQLPRIDYDIQASWAQCIPLSRPTMESTFSVNLMVLPSAKEFGVTRKEIIAEPSRPNVLKDMERAFSQALSTAAIFASHKDHPPRLVR